MAGHTALGIIPWLQPEAGLSVWCQLPDDRVAAARARHCLRAGSVLAPGNALSQSQRTADHLRFNVPQCRDPWIWQAQALR